MFTWIHIKRNGQQTWKAFWNLYEPEGIWRGISNKDCLSLTMKHINVFSVKTKVIVIPGLPDLWERFSKKQKGAQYEVNLVAFMFLIFYLILNITPFSNICSADSWLGSPVLNFENVPSFLFLYSTLHLLKLTCLMQNETLKGQSY